LTKLLYFEGFYNILLGSLEFLS